MTAARRVTVAALPLAAVVGWVYAGWPGAAGAAWGIAAVGLNNIAAAEISARGGRTERGIDIVRVVAGVPIRLVLLAVAIAVAVLVLDLPSRPVGVAVCAGEIAVLFAQSWCVLRGPTFVGPLEVDRL